MADDDGLRVWSKEVEEYVRTMVNELLNASPLQNISSKKQEHCEPSHVEQSDSFTTASERKTDMLEQIQKIRRVLLLDQPEDILARSEGALEVGMADCKCATETNRREEQIGLEVSKQTLLQELSDASEQQLKQKDPGGETGGEGGCPGNQPCTSELSKGTGEILCPEWTSSVSRKTDAEMEIEQLACQVQFLVHQLTTCRQNLLKAEREVNMLHDENREFRSLIRDILAAFSSP